MVRDRLARPIDDLQRLIDETEAESSTVIRTTPAWREAADVRPSTPGLGPVRSATLHAALPELGVLHQRDIAPLVGVAPLHDARGQRAGPGLAAAGARRSAQSDRWRSSPPRGVTRCSPPSLTGCWHEGRRRQ